MSVPPTPDGMTPVWVWIQREMRWVPAIVNPEDGSTGFEEEPNLEEGDEIIAVERTDEIPPSPMTDEVMRQLKAEWN